MRMYGGLGGSLFKASSPSRSVYVRARINHGGVLASPRFRRGDGSQRRAVSFGRLYFCLLGRLRLRDGGYSSIGLRRPAWNRPVFRITSEPGSSACGHSGFSNPKERSSRRGLRYAANTIEENGRKI